MTITQSQINELKDAISRNRVDQLIEKWESELFMAKASKKSNATVNVGNHNDSEFRQVVGKIVGDHYILANSPWIPQGAGRFCLFHIETGIAVLQGRRDDVTKAAAEYLKWDERDTLVRRMNEVGKQALANMPQEFVDQYRKFYEMAKGR